MLLLISRNSLNSKTYFCDRLNLYKFDLNESKKMTEELVLYTWAGIYFIFLCWTVTQPLYFSWIDQDCLLCLSQLHGNPIDFFIIESSDNYLLVCEKQVWTDISIQRYGYIISSYTHTRKDRSHYIFILHFKGKTPLETASAEQPWMPIWIQLILNCGYWSDEMKYCNCQVTVNIY